MANHNSKSALFIRADLNVPLKEAHILDDFKLQTFIPVIANAQKKYPIIVIGTHQSRPCEFDPHMSTKIHAQWLSRHGFPVTHIPMQNTFTEKMSDGIYMIENLRFFQGEQATNSKKKKQFAQQLSTLAGHYLFDAIAASHRSDSSVEFLPCLFTEKNKTVSQYTRNEYYLFERLSRKRFAKLLILGGIKAKTKLAYIPQLIKKGFTIILCPPLSLSFSPDKARELGWILAKEWVQCAQDVLQSIGPHKRQLILPTDYVLLKKKTNAQVKPFIGLGSNTLILIKALIAQNKSVVINGLIGSIDIPKTLETSQAIYHILEKASQEKQIIFAGGNTIAAARKLNISDSLIHFSTAGGAALAILTNKPLPALRCLCINT